MPFFSRPQHSTAVERWPCCAVALRRTAWSEHGMASVKTRPHCVNQMGKTHSKPLVARHGRGKAWERHAMCESAFIQRYLETLGKDYRLRDVNTRRTVSCTYTLTQIQLSMTTPRIKMLNEWGGTFVMRVSRQITPMHVFLISIRTHFIFFFSLIHQCK